MNGVEFRIYQFLLNETKGTTKCMEVSEIAKQMNIKRQTVYTHLCNLHKHKLIFRIYGKPAQQWYAEAMALYSVAADLWREGKHGEAISRNLELNAVDMRGVFDRNEMRTFLQNNVK
jgi:hypothetical protein